MKTTGRLLKSRQVQYIYSLLLKMPPGPRHVKLLIFYIRMYFVCVPNTYASTKERRVYISNTAYPNIKVSQQQRQPLPSIQPARQPTKQTSNQPTNKKPEESKQPKPTTKAIYHRRRSAVRLAVWRPRVVWSKLMDSQARQVACMPSIVVWLRDFIVFVCCLFKGFFWFVL